MLIVNDHHQEINQQMYTNRIGYMAYLNVQKGPGNGITIGMPNFQGTILERVSD